MANKTNDSKNFVMTRLGAFCMADDMANLGIRNTMHLAKAVNRVRYRKLIRTRRRLFRNHFDELLEEHGGLARDPGCMEDGWLLDESMSLPHLEALLDQADELIAERGGKNLRHGSKPFIQDIHTPADLTRFPAFLDFVTSSEVLAVASRHLDMVPMLSRTLPPGVRFVESWREYDEPGAPLRASQLYHLDHHDDPLVYVIVLLRDTTIKNEPWTLSSRVDLGSRSEGLGIPETRRALPGKRRTNVRGGAHGRRQSNSPTRAEPCCSSTRVAAFTSEAVMLSSRGIK